MSDPTPADIPSLVEIGAEALYIVSPLEGTRPLEHLSWCAYAETYPDIAATIRIQARAVITAALHPKEAELVKPPREYEVSGGAVGGGDLIERIIAIMEEAQSVVGPTNYDAAVRIASLFRTPAVGGIPAGMVPWSGGDSAPEDWDGGSVLLRNGTMSGDDYIGRWWKTGVDPQWYDIIAYTPKVPTASHDAARERLARMLYLRRNPVEHPENEDFVWLCAKRSPPRVLADVYADADAILAAGHYILDKATVTRP